MSKDEQKKELIARFMGSVSGLALDKLQRGFAEADGGKLKALGKVHQKFTRVAPESMADQATDALFSAFANAKEQAATDKLTGLANRAPLEAHLLNVIDEYHRETDPQYNSPTVTRPGDFTPQKRPAVLFIDVDSFKAMNDTYGHDKGDILLQNIATAILEHKRPSDFAARIGGDEFIIVLDDISPHSHIDNPAPLTQQIADRYKELLTGASVDVGEGKHVACPFSIGIKEIEARDTPESAIKAADEAMYKDKDTCVERGSVKNLIITYPDRKITAPPHTPEI